jgi:hypothetical protein
MTRILILAIAVTASALGLAALATWWSYRVLGNPDPIKEVRRERG